MSPPDAYQTSEHRKLILELLSRKAKIENEVAADSTLANGMAHAKDPLVEEYHEILAQLRILL